MTNLRFITVLMVALATSLIFSSCKKDDEVTPNTEVNSTDSDDENEQLEVILVSDIDADAAKEDIFTYYSLKDNKIVAQSDSNTTNWDIAFQGTTILVNGGTSGSGQGQADVVDNIFDELTSAPTSGYEENAVPKEWYEYNNPADSHLIKPIAGKIIVLKTASGNYAKIEILSYYEGNPDLEGKTYADVTSRYYTFQYVLQPDGSTNF